MGPFFTTISMAVSADPGFLRALTVQTCARALQWCLSASLHYQVFLFEGYPHTCLADEMTQQRVTPVV